MTLGAQRLYDVSLQAIDQVVFQIKIGMRIDRSHIDRQRAAAQLSDETMLDEVLRPRLRRRQHDQQRGARLRRAVKDDAHGG